MSGNVITTQILNDGPRNVVIKVEGILDTSDVAATGTIGASGFTTTTGSKSVAFVAGALLPTLGQYLTFGDSAATFVAGTYITGIVDATHITVSNAALKDNAAAAVTITGSAGAVVILDPALLSAMDNAGTLATRLKIKKIQHNIEDTLGLILYWEATASTRIEELVGRGELEYYKFGGVYASDATVAATGYTGRITLATQGWASSAVLSFSLILECVK